MVGVPPSTDESSDAYNALFVNLGLPPPDPIGLFVRPWDSLFAVALAHLWRAALARWSAVPAIRVAGPAAIALAAVFVGVVRIAPLIYPLTYADVQNHNRLHEALAVLDLHDAVVFAGGGLTNTDVLDLPENLPLDLVPFD